MSVLGETKDNATVTSEGLVSGFRIGCAPVACVGSFGNSMFNQVGVR